ncbi:hypothetical protein [Sorangium sp. So ce1078]|uniref:hypothetical protein n=1 Tax=Sorangium sp. So ce1078 TaxID=3133329 RepID=UPI003F63204A
MNDILTVASARLPAEVGFDRARAHARLFRSGLEGDVTAQYVEWRLGPADDQVDFLVALDRPGPQGTQVFRELEERSRTWTGQDRKAWLPVARLGGAWSGPEAPLWPRVPTVWLELDDVRGAAAAPPCVSVCLVPAYARPLDPLGAPRSDEELDTIHRVLDLVGAPASARLASALARCFAALPRGGRLIHLSVMLGRDPRAVKLYGKVPRAALPKYLKDIGWSGELAELERFQRSLYPEAYAGDEVYFDLNLANHDAPGRASLGLAYSQQQVAHGPCQDPRRRPILGRLVEAGLCHPAKAAAVAGWPGESCERVAGEAWPRRFVRFLDIKLVWDEERGPSAKAYLGTSWPAGLF